MSGLTFLEQFEASNRWPTAPAKRRFQNLKRVNRGMEETHRLALTMRGVVDRSLDDLEGLQASDYSTYQIFEANDLAFKLIDLENIKTSRVGHVPRRGIMSPAYIRLCPSKSAHSRFYYWYFFAAYLNNIFNGMGGGVRQNLTPTDLLEFPVPLPDLPTQKAIAAFLDRETARIDQLIEKKQRLVELLGEKRKSEFDGIVMGRIGFSHELVESHVDWFGLVPAHWTVCRFQRLIASKVDYRGRTPEKVDGGVFLVTARNIRNGLIDYERAAEYTTEEEWLKLRGRGAPEAGDVLMTTEAPLGEIAQVDRTDVAFAQRIMKFQANADRMSNDFLAAFMQTSEFQQSLSLHASGSTAKGIKSERLAHLFGVAPPLDEQALIIKRLRPALAGIDAVRKPLVSSVDRLKEYRSALITAAVTGKIDVEIWSRRGEGDRRLDRIEEDVTG